MRTTICYFVYKKNFQFNSMDGWMYGWMAGWIDGWVDGNIYIYIYIILLFNNNCYMESIEI